MNDFVTKMKGYLDKGVEVSKDALKTAGSKVQEMGDKGVAKIEIKQLETQAQKQLASLGLKVYELIVGKGELTISSDNPDIQPLIEAIKATNHQIDLKTDQTL